LAHAQQQPQIQIQEFRHAGEFHVPLNKSQILRLDQPFTDLLVGNAEVADVLALTNRSIYVLGKTPGSTNLTIYGPGKQLIAVVDLVVGFDAELSSNALEVHVSALRRKLGRELIETVRGLGYRIGAP